MARLLRGRVGTEWAAAGHSVGEGFALLEADAVRLVQLPDWATGSQAVAELIGSTSPSGTAAIAVTGESLRPPSPVRLDAVFAVNGDLTLSWIRRSRRGWAWVDEIDAPLGESREEYRVTVIGSLGSLERGAGTPELTIAAADLAAVGSGQATIEVRQIGDWAASRPAQRTIIIP